GDWSSDVCSSDLLGHPYPPRQSSPRRLRRLPRSPPERAGMSTTAPPLSCHPPASESPPTLRSPGSMLPESALVFRPARKRCHPPPPERTWHPRLADTPHRPRPHQSPPVARRRQPE